MNMATPFPFAGSSSILFRKALKKSSQEQALLLNRPFSERRLGLFCQFNCLIDQSPNFDLLCPGSLKFKALGFQYSQFPLQFNQPGVDVFPVG